MVDDDSMVPGLQFVRARFSTFLLGELFTRVQTCAECRYFTQFKWPYFISASCYSPMVGQTGSPRRILCMLTWPWPDPRSRPRSIWTSTIAHNSFSETDFRISFYESYHDSSNFPECRYFTKFKWPYFGSAWHHSQMVGHVGSPTGIVHANMTWPDPRSRSRGFWTSDN